jgi:predicted dinucleotide-binding enzyme
VKDAIASAGDLAGKVVLDCTNPLVPDLSGLEIGHTTSGGEEVARLAPGARVVKIFNTTGADNMADPNYGGTPATMLYAGDDAGARSIAAALARELGFDPVDFGPLASARLLEPMALTWIWLAYRQKLGRDFVLQIVRRPARA